MATECALNAQKHGRVVFSFSVINDLTSLLNALQWRYDEEPSTAPLCLLQGVLRQGNDVAEILRSGVSSEGVEKASEKIG